MFENAAAGYSIRLPPNLAESKINHDVWHLVTSIDSIELVAKRSAFHDKCGKIFREFPELRLPDGKRHPVNDRIEWEMTVPSMR